MTSPYRGRVVRVIARLNIGGPAWHVSVLDLGLRRLGWDGVLVHGRVGADEQDTAATLAQQGVSLARIDELGRRVRPGSDLIAFFRLCRLIWRTRPDVVHTHTAKAGTLGRMAATLYNLVHPRRRRCLIVHTFHGHVFHGYFNEGASRLVQIAERALARLTDRIVVLSGSQRWDLVDRYRVASAEQTAIVPLGLDLSRFASIPPPSAAARACFGLPPDSIVFTFVGRLVPIKAPEVLVDAFAIVRGQQPAARLLIVGDGSERATVEQAISRHALHPAVTLLGWRDDLERVYEATDLLVLTSRNEGTPVAVIEALAAGRPAVAFDVGGVRDVIVHDETGVVVPPGRTHLLADQMVRLAGDQPLRARLGAAGRNDVLARFAGDRLVEDIARIYDTGLIEKRRLSAAGGA